MPLLVAALLVVAVHLATAVMAWQQVGLLADDHEFVGVATLRRLGEAPFAGMFVPEAVVSPRALYRPFVDLLFWLEQPWFAFEGTGYHVVNSAMHCGTALLWFVLVRRLSGSIAAALATALVFAGWPGHSEATHWIAARTNVQSTFFMSAALVAHDAGLMRARPTTRWALLAIAAVLAVVAIGSKESAVFVVPLAALLSWVRAPGGPPARRATAAAVTVAALAIAVLAWLWWRARCLGTWGAGTHYGWQAQRIGADTCTDWLAVLLAPVHHGYVAPGLSWLLAVLHAALLVLAVAAMRIAKARAVLAAGALLLGLGYVAGLGLERLDLNTLENVRYSYEPALGLCALLGVGIATLPLRARGMALAVVVATHALALDQNRQSWLRAAAVDRCMRNEIVDVARATQRPIRVFDAPGVHDGAFAWLNGFTEFLFLQRTAPAGTNLRGAVSSTQEWPAALHELATAAAAKQALADTFVVQWDDGALVPFALDAQWPRQPWQGASIGYARIARVHPFAGTALPVHVLMQNSQPLRLHVEARAGGEAWSGAVLDVAAADAARALALDVMLPATLAAGEPVAIELVVASGSAAGGERRTYALGDAVPVVRR